MIFFRTDNSSVFKKIHEQYNEIMIKTMARKTKISKVTVKSFFENHLDFQSSLIHKTPYMRIYIVEYKKFLFNLVKNRLKFQRSSLSSKTHSSEKDEIFYSIFYKAYHKADIAYLFYALYMNIKPNSSTYHEGGSANLYRTDSYGFVTEEMKVLFKRREVINKAITNLNNMILTTYELSALIQRTASERLFQNLYGTFAIIA